MHDGNIESVGGDCAGICPTCTGQANRNGDNRCPSPQHDEVIASQLNDICDTSKWTVYGEDRSIPSTDLRHIRVAYSMDGESWTCYTQSEGWFDTPRTDCSVSSISPTSGVVLNFPSPAKYLMFGFAGNTHLWEVELRSCPAA